MKTYTITETITYKVAAKDEDDAVERLTKAEDPYNEYLGDVINRVVEDDNWN
jgi:hypothetical protein